MQTENVRLDNESQSGPLFLTGFMGAGKTTVGQAIASLLAQPFVDLDARIVTREGKSIREIFAHNGEGYFRDCETALLREFSSDSHGVVATGGGIVMREENRRLMHGCGRIVYLRARWETLQGRLENSAERPLIDVNRDWGVVKDLWLSRQSAYHDADLVIDTDSLTGQQVAERIVSLIAAGEKLS